MRSKKSKKKLLIAVLLAAVTGFSVFNSINNQKSTIDMLNQKLEEQQKTITSLKTSPTGISDNVTSEKVVVAKQNIKAGTKLTSEMLEVKEYAPEVAPKDSLSDISMLTGQIVAEDITAGNPVPRSRTIGLQTNKFDIPAGMRAITIPANYIQGLASYITVGSKIDVISVKKDNEPEFVLQGVQIISLERQGAPNVNNSLSNSSAITLLVPVTSVSRLVDAMVNGKLQIVARGFGDNQVVKTQRHVSRSRNISNYYSAPPVGAIIPPPTSIKLPQIDGSKNSLVALPAPTKTNGKKVELIQANVKTEVDFNNDL